MRKTYTPSDLEVLVLQAMFPKMSTCFHAVNRDQHPPGENSKRRCSYSAQYQRSCSSGSSSSCGACGSCGFSDTPGTYGSVSHQTQLAQYQRSGSSASSSSCGACGSCGSSDTPGTYGSVSHQAQLAHPHLAHPQVNWHIHNWILCHMRHNRINPKSTSPQ